MNTGIVKEHYDLLRLVVDRGAYPVLVVDQNNVVQITNPAADELFRRTADELVGRTFPFPIEGRRLQQTRHIEAEDGAWTAEMHVERADLRGKRLYVISLRDTTERTLLQGVLEKAQLVDPLTGLLNEQGFMVLTEQQVKLANRTGRGLILMLVDVDDMDTFNKAHGRSTGDLVLKEVGLLIKQTYRDSDIVGRLARDEFGLTAVEAHSDSGGILVARLRDTFWDYNANSSTGYQVSVSTGLVRYEPREPSSAADLMASARRALEENKRQRGRLSSTA